MEGATIGVRELRDGLSRHLAMVRDGTEITVTDHGKPIARIVPIGSDRLADLIATGRVIPAAVREPTLPSRRRASGPVGELIER